MKLGARKVLNGRPVGATKGATTPYVKIDVGGIDVTASMTNAAVDDL